MPPPPAAPALPVELIEDIFLRLPADEPASLLRASLANKHWLGLLTGARFRGRYREFHGSPPMLGFLCSWGSKSLAKKEGPVGGFVSTTNFSSHIPDDQEWRDEVWEYSVWDCRHGRVLLCNTNWSPPLFVVWDPKTGCRRELGLPFREPGVPSNFSSQRAAVLCAVSGCDHRACHDGPFQVVLVSLESDDACYVSDSVSSPNTREWRKPCSRRHRGSDRELWSEEKRYDLDLAAAAYIEPLPPVLVQDALHFMLSYEDEGILKYDLGTECLSLIDAPLAETEIARCVILIAMEDGSLGFACVDGLKLNLWSRQMGYEGVETWTQRIAINLNNLLPIHNLTESLRLIGSVEDCDIIFVTTDLGIYQIHLKSLRWKKIWKTEKYCALFPYMRF